MGVDLAADEIGGHGNGAAGAPGGTSTFRPKSGSLSMVLTQKAPPTQ